MFSQPASSSFELLKSTLPPTMLRKCSDIKKNCCIYFCFQCKFEWGISDHGNILICFTSCRSLFIEWLIQFVFETVCVIFEKLHDLSYENKCTFHVLATGVVFCSAEFTCLYIWIGQHLHEWNRLVTWIKYTMKSKQNLTSSIKLQKLK